MGVSPGAVLREVDECVEVLEVHRQHCVKTGRYREAEIARARLQALCSIEQERRRDDLLNRQDEERIAVKEGHDLEREHFNALWNEKIAEFEENAIQSQNALTEKLEKDLAEYLEKIQVEAE